MKAEKVQNINFKSGLNRKILFQEKMILPKIQENLFAKQGVYADFAKNKPAALANKFCREILEKLSNSLGKELSIPPMITVYKKESAIKGEDSNFCIPDTREVIKGEYPYLGRSIFFRNYKNLENINAITDIFYNAKRISTSHFLSPYMHEWLHSLHLDYIYSKYGYNGFCDVLKTSYPEKNEKLNGFDIVKEMEHVVLSPNENEIVYDVLGEYSTKSENQYAEVFSEAFTKFICESLSEDCMSLVKNPIDLIKNTPKEFQQILKKVINFEGIVPKQ